jgi:hypothetical protein
LDSEVIIDVLRSRSPNIVREWINVANTDESLFYSPAEDRHGMRDQEREPIERMISGMSCKPPLTGKRLKLSTAASRYRDRARQCRKRVLSWRARGLRPHQK